MQIVDGSNKSNIEHKNTQIECSGDANFDFEKEVNVHQQPQTNTFFSDYMLRDEWKGNFMSPIHLKAMFNGILLVLNSWKQDLPPHPNKSQTMTFVEQKIPLSSKSKIIKLLRNVMNMITKFDNFINSLVTD